MQRRIKFCCCKHRAKNASEPNCFCPSAEILSCNQAFYNAFCLICFFNLLYRNNNISIAIFFSADLNLRLIFCVSRETSIYSIGLPALHNF